MIEIKTKKEGAELTSIKFNNHEILHDGKEYWNRQAPVLFPIVGQLKNGETIIENNTLRMGQHGFARDMIFREMYKKESEHKYVLKSSIETKEKYPYVFEFYVTYKVENNILTVRYDVINKDNKQIIFGIGAHPAFKCNYTTEEFEIRFNQEEENIEIFKLEKGLLKSSKESKEFKENLIKDNKIIKICKGSFDDDAIIMSNIASKSVTLYNHKLDKEVLEFDFTGFPYLALWSKPNSNFICIEPWYNTTDNVNSDGIFENKKDIIKLNEKEKFRCEFKIKFKEEIK